MKYPVFLLNMSFAIFDACYHPSEFVGEIQQHPVYGVCMQKSIFIIVNIREHLFKFCLNIYLNTNV